MRRFLFFLMLSFSAFADWKSDADIFVSGEGDAAQARARLEKNKDLDGELTKALEKPGPDEKLALSVIRTLPRLSMVEILLNKLQHLDVQEPRGEAYFISLASLNQTAQGHHILDELSKKVDITNLKVSSSLRVVFLESLAEKNRIPVPETLLKLLEDSSFEMRLKVMDIAAGSIQSRPQKYEAFLHKALDSSPYPLRLKAVEVVEKLKPQFKKNYKADIEKCAKTDQSELVKTACAQVKF